LHQRLQRQNIEEKLKIQDERRSKERAKRNEISVSAVPFSASHTHNWQRHLNGSGAIANVQSAFIFIECGALTLSFGLWAAAAQIKSAWRATIGAESFRESPRDLCGFKCDRR
jgi:hypothetical protein